MSTQYANGRIVTDGLLLALNAADTLSYPGSGTTWTDLSGYGYNATLVNGPTYSSINGGYIAFDGTNDQAQLTATAVNSSAGTYVSVDFWMYWTGGNNGFPMEFSSYRLWMPSTYFGFNTGNGDLYGIDSGGLLNTWNHIVAVFYNGAYTNSQIYVNGVLQSLSQKQNSQSLGNYTGSQITIAGYRGNVTSYPFPGRIASFRIYNRQISATEVLQNYNAQKARFGLK